MKVNFRINGHNIGYIASRAGVQRSPRVHRATKPNLVAAYFMKRERSPGDPEAVNDLPLCGLNQWPKDLPVFRPTMLAQTEVRGLDILSRDGEWAPAPTLQGAFLVNIGQMLMRWTNDIFPSTPHRVVNPAGRERYSIPFFFDPDFETVVSCLPPCTGPGNPPKHEPICYLDHILAFTNENFDPRGNAPEPASGFRRVAAVMLRADGPAGLDLSGEIDILTLVDDGRCSPRGGCPASPASAPKCPGRWNVQRCPSCPTCGYDLQTSPEGPSDRHHPGV